MRAYIFSKVYVLTRFVITNSIYLFQYIFNKPKDLETAVKFGDSQLSNLDIIGNIIFDFKIPSNISIEIFELTFPSPLIAASFKSEPEILDIWLRMGLGGIMYKTIMKNPRNGNSRPRIQDVSIDGKKGLFNALGLPGPGLKVFKKALSNGDIWKYNRPIGISIGGDNRSEYIDNTVSLDTQLKTMSHPYFFELNISCPNTKNGLTIGENISDLEFILSELRKKIRVPIAIKISPDLSNLEINNIAELSQQFEKIMINAGNTQFKKPNELQINPNDFSMEGGGLSGPGILKRTIEMVKLLSTHDLPIIATGGISKIEHVLELKEAGASLFGMATSLVLDPYCIPKINYKL